MLQNNKKEVTATFSFKSAHVTTSFSALHAYFFKFITKSKFTKNLQKKFDIHILFTESDKMMKLMLKF